MIVALAFAAARVVPRRPITSATLAIAQRGTPRARLPPLATLGRTEGGIAPGLDYAASAHPPGRLQGVIGSHPGGCAESRARQSPPDRVPSSGRYYAPW